MAKNKQPDTTTRERATVSRERRLALAMVALLDSENDHDHADHIDPARALLSELGYGTLQSIPLRLRQLGIDLKAATDSGNYARVAELGAEMERVKAGKAAKVAVSTGENK